MNQEDVGKYIKKLRVSNGLSQSALADKLGVTFQAVSKWENGRNLPDMQTLSMISTLFNVDIDSIIGAKRNLKSNNKPLVILVLLMLILSLIILIVSSKGFFASDSSKMFYVKELNSANTNYVLHGNITQYNNYSTFLVNSLSYTGKQDKTIYKEINCVLYREYANSKSVIKECGSKSNISIKDYLKSLKIRVDNYDNICPDYINTKYHIELVITDDESNDIIHLIPIDINDMK